MLRTSPRGSRRAKSGSSQLSVNAAFGLQQIPEYLKPDMMNATEFARFRKEIYEENDNNWEIINRGMPYNFNNELEGALRIGERSTLIAMNAGVKFTEVEFEAMRIIDKDNSEDNYTKYFSSPLSTVIRQASELITLTNRIYQATVNE